MAETLNLLFQKRADGTFELQVRGSWSGRFVSGNFVPPYHPRQLNALLKRLNNLESDQREQREIGYRLFLALCGAETPGASRREASEQSVQAMLRSVIQRTLRRRATVALTLCFGPGCEEFVRYPWELLHNDEHFLLASGVFTLTRAILRPDMPEECPLPVYPPLRLLYIGASPIDCLPLETERSFEALERGLSRLVDDGLLWIDRLDPPTFDELVRYLSTVGGANNFEDHETTVPCYAIHFDGHGAYGRLCPAEDCDALSDANAQRCRVCETSLKQVRPQTYLCFCDDEGRNRLIDTHSLRELLVSSDVRLAVFSACETATLSPAGRPEEKRRAVVDATLATALLTAQVSAVVAMPFSLQDDLSPTFMYHFYDDLANGRTLEGALSRARQAMLPLSKAHGWFVPVLYRHVGEDEDGPVALLALSDEDEPDEHDHPLAHLGASTTFVGREREMEALCALLDRVVGSVGHPAAPAGEQGRLKHQRTRPGTHHIALTGPAGIGKSELAFELVRRNQERFPGGIIGVTLEGGKSLGDALVEIAHALRLPARSVHNAQIEQGERVVLGALRVLANRQLPCLLLLDSFEEVQERAEVGSWYHFLCALPEEIVVLLTSRFNPATVAALEGGTCRWYEFPVGKMTSQDLLKLFAELAASSGLTERIHLEDEYQQALLQEISTLLDGYPLGAQLIFGTARSIHGKVYAPEAATRSLEEVRDELRETLPEGIWSVLDVAYRRLPPVAQQLLPYLSAFKLPFSREQIIMLVAPETPHLARITGYLSNGTGAAALPEPSATRGGVPGELRQDWRSARDALVQAAFIQFDGRVYTIHSQVRHYALAHLAAEERQRAHRVVASYYSSLPQPSPYEWFAAFEHLEDAGELQDLQNAVQLAVKASWALRGRSYAAELQAMLRRAEGYALLLNDKTGEGQIQCCLGAILRRLGKYAEAVGCLTRSLTLHRAGNERDEAAWALYELAMLFREEGHFAQAGQHAGLALSLFREAGDANGEAWMQVVMGEVSRGYGRYHEAMGSFQLALESFRTMPSNEGYPSALRDRGSIYEALGDYAQALADYGEALRLFNALGSHYWQAWILTDQSMVYLNQGKFEQAAEQASRAVEIFREAGAKRGEGWSIRVLGDIARKRGRFTDAHSYYSQAMAIFTNLGSRVDLARVINAQAAIAFAEGEPLAAREHYEHALAIAQEQGTPQIKGRALRGLGDVMRILHQESEAEQRFQEALAIAIDLDTPPERCAVLHRLGQLHYDQQRYPQALQAWAQALAYDQRVGHPEREALKARIAHLVQEQHLESAYAQLCQESSKAG
ncbi:MAG TPA: tetratricopeptide repeat protein [Ktedonobacteraceae bacterium]|jgi:tetratricopeptide (TPR) repeat protein